MAKRIYPLRGRLNGIMVGIGTSIWLLVENEAFEVQGAITLGVVVKAMPDIFDEMSKIILLEIDIILIGVFQSAREIYELLRLCQDVFNYFPYLQIQILE